MSQEHSRWPTEEHATAIDLMLWAARNVPDEVVDELARELELIPEALSDSDREVLRRYGTLSTGWARCGHKEYDDEIWDALEGRPEIRALLDYLRDTPPEGFRYRVDPEAGIHQAIRLADSEVRAGDLHLIGTGTLAERDFDYCCEMCDGLRRPPEGEEEAEGIYWGWWLDWYTLTAFVELAPEDERRLLLPMPPDTLVRRVLQPWSA